MATFCTLFDSKYIDKGIALYESLSSVTSAFKLYVFAFDQETYDILIDKKYEHMSVIHLDDFETDRMRRVKKERSAAEYCWTCTPISIEYVLTKYNEEQCTYLDADLYFFASPNILLSEIEDMDSSVIITEHRFPPDKIQKGIEMSGKYCVQFNTFNNDQKAMKVLKVWKEQCLDWCYYTKNGDKMGDQKYLENWTKDFEGVHELQHLGGGVAPWNVSQYTYYKRKEGIFLLHKDEVFKLVFYHFQNIKYLPFGIINISLGECDKEVKEKTYIPYLIHIEKIRKQLKSDYGLVFASIKTCYSNWFFRLIQRHIMPFKIINKSDIIPIKRLRN